MIIESEIVAVGSVCGVMSGKHYNRALRSHKTVSEALQHICFKAFLSTLTEAEQIQMCNVIKGLTEKYPEEAFVATVTSDEFNQICENYSVYVSQGNSACKLNWTVQRQKHYGFSGTACDQTIEQTCNRDAKIKQYYVFLVNT